MKNESARILDNAIADAIEAADLAGLEDLAQTLETAREHLPVLDDLASIPDRLGDLAEWNETARYSLHAESLSAEDVMYSLDFRADETAPTSDLSSSTDLRAIARSIDNLGLWKAV